MDSLPEDSILQNDSTLKERTETVMGMAAEKRQDSKADVADKREEENAMNWTGHQNKTQLNKNLLDNL